MKKLLTLLAACLALAGYSQTAPTPAPSPSDKVGFLRSALESSNITATAYGTYFLDAKKVGGGFLLSYQIGDYASVGIGSDWAGQWRQFGATVDVHYTKQLSEKWSATGKLIAAAGTSVGGAGGDNGTFATAEGSDISINYELSKHFVIHAGAGYITRQNCGDFSGGSILIPVSLTFRY